MKKLFSAAFVLLFAYVLSAQSLQVLGQANSHANSFMKMNIQNKDASSPCPVRMSSISVDASIMGNTAVTTLDIIFQNDTDRVLEGEFEFPLGENESIVGYALDINGKMRKGVVVEKDKGRQVFEAVVRQGIDPGLVEMTEGNNFKARVYPIPSRGSRHLQLTYQSELKKASSKDSRVYVYSALTDDVLEHFDFKITALGNKKDVMASGNVLQFDDLDSGYTAHFSKENVSVDAPVTIVIPNAYTNLKDSASAFLEDKGKDTFFYCYLPLDENAVAKKLPKRLAVYYDVSSSAAKRNVQAELALLARYIEKLESPEIIFVPFSNKLYDSKNFSGGTENIMTGIIKCIQECGFDGATDLSYDFSSLLPADEVLVFTDGICNWSGLKSEKKTDAITYANNAVVNTVNSSFTADYAWLQKTARVNGGVCININASSISEPVEKLDYNAVKASDVLEDDLKLLTEEPLRLIHAEYDSSAVKDVFPLDGSLVKPDFSLSGKLCRKQGSVTLQFGHGKTVEQTVRLELSTVGGVYADNVARQWASKKIDALNFDYDSNRNEIVELAKLYGIVTKDTSLIVLDTVQDYVRYGIVPPAELKEEYDRIVSRTSAAVKPSGEESGSSIPKKVYSKFEEFRKWWNTDKKDFKKKQPGKGEEPVPVPRPPIHPMNETSSDMSVMDSAVYSESSFESESVMSAPMANARIRSSGSGSFSERRMSRAASPSLAKSRAEKSSGQAIQLQAWNPDAKYLSVLKRTPVASMYAEYLDLKKQYESSPAFYMEVADYFAEEGLQDESLRILSNLAELELENSDILRALGNKLVEHEQYELAVPVFEKLVKIRSEVPQFYRDLGMAYYYAGQAQKAVDVLYSVAYKKWDGRFDEVQQIALNDMNAIIAEKSKELDLTAIDKKLVENFDMDVRVILTWNTDNCDVDLWVTDADGEKCFYRNKLTANGGRMSRDFTQGYGPEEFCIKEAPGGKLKIEANYYGNHQQKLLQPVTVQAEVYTNFGRKDQKRQVLTLQLDSVKETFFIGNVE
ncbi:MAG: DUF2135 domain-containing protein [Treponema sp.]|nr:DUF2135 domain-containing protein [Treponema sp.]